MAVQTRSPRRALTSQHCRGRSQAALLRGMVLVGLALSCPALSVPGTAWSQAVDRTVLARSAQRGLTVLVDGTPPASGWCASDVDLAAELGSNSPLAETGALEAFMPRVMELLVKDCPTLAHVRLRVVGGAVAALEASASDGWAMRRQDSAANLDKAPDPSKSKGQTPAPNAPAVVARERPGGAVINRLVDLPDRIAVSFGAPVVTMPATYTWLDLAGLEFKQPWTEARQERRALPTKVSFAPDHATCDFTTDADKRFCQIRVKVGMSLEGASGERVGPAQTVLLTMQIERREKGLLVAMQRGNTGTSGGLSVGTGGLVLKRDPEGVLRSDQDGPWAGVIHTTLPVTMTLAASTWIEHDGELIQNIRDTGPVRRTVSRRAMALANVDIPITLHMPKEAAR